MDRTNATIIFKQLKKAVFKTTHTNAKATAKNNYAFATCLQKIIELNGHISLKEVDNLEKLSLARWKEEDLKATRSDQICTALDMPAR